MSLGTPVLSARGLRFRYPGEKRDALRGMDFDLWPQEVLGVLGPNGSGKSTLLAALLDAKRGERGGEVVLHGPEERPSRLWVGCATQQIALYRHLTTRENLVHMARLVVPGRRVRAAVATCVEQYGLGGVVSRQVGQLSGGWQRLVHIAASFIHEPPIRFLDEPTTALDFEARNRLVELVRTWPAAGVATVVTSHYPEDLEEMCGRLVVIKDGTVVRSATIAQLLSGLARQVVVEAEQDGVRYSGRAELQPRVDDLAATVARAVKASEAPADATVAGVRLTMANLRGLLTEDPQLASVVEER